MIPAALLEAYRGTTYRVELPGRRHLDLRIDRGSPAAVRLLRRFEARSAAFLTACNPFSRLCSDAENAAAQRRLERELGRRRYRTLPGLGIGSDQEWKPERGVFVPGLPRAMARRLAAKYRQFGFIYLRAGRRVELVLLDQ